MTKGSRAGVNRPLLRSSPRKAGTQKAVANSGDRGPLIPARRE